MRRHVLKLVILMTLVLLMGAGVAVAVLLNLRIPGVESAQNDEERILSIARFIARDSYDNRLTRVSDDGNRHALYSRRLRQ